MIGHERWELGAAHARVIRCGSYTVAELRGVLTPQGYEALHRRLALEPSAVTLVLGPALLLAVTNISAVEAAIRGTPDLAEFKPTKLLVHPLRMGWALEHCRLMALDGFSMSAFALRAAEPASARSRAEA